MHPERNDLDRARALLESGEYACVLVKDETVYTSKKSGIAPLVKFLSSGLCLEGFSAADKIVGKAAALLFIKMGVCRVFASVLSESAAAVLSARKIPYDAKVMTPSIRNRAGTGPCPMELAVEKTDDPQEAFLAVCKTLESLRKKEENK